MPLTGAKFYPNIFHATNRLAIRDMVAFLIDDHATITGPGWSIVEAYDGTAGSRQTPSTITGTGALASFTGTFSWKDNTVAVGDWIVLRTNVGGTEFQFFWRVASTSSWEYKLIPLDDFVTDPSTLTSSPDLPVSSVGSGTSVVTHGQFVSGENWYSVVADEQMASIFLHRGGGSQVTWGYVGSLDQPHPSDTRPFVIYDNPGEVNTFDANFGSFWNRLSPVDNNTVIGLGYWTWLRRGNDLTMTNDVLWLHSRIALPMAVSFDNAGHRHFAGFTRHVYQGHELLGHRNAFGNFNFISMTDNVTRPPIVVRWDGTTEW